MNEKNQIIKECLENAVLISKDQPNLNGFECWQLAIALQGVIETKKLTETILFNNKDSGIHLKI